MRKITKKTTKEEVVTCDICGVEGSSYRPAVDYIHNCPICKKDSCPKCTTMIPVHTEHPKELSILMGFNSLEIIVCVDCHRDYYMVNAELTNIKFVKRDDQDGCLICGRTIKNKYCEVCSVLYK